ncbi:MAG: spiro-SPASM protein, partial [Leptospiraceae bacterium]|nr:spiro-SPASM protein [Leptospiraceae bacterium]
LIEYLPPSQSEDSDIDEVYFVYFEGICPIFDLQLTKELKERHRKYLSQYSYSENLPPGIVPYFISREFLQTLPRGWKTKPHDYLLKNINQYDTEIFFHPPDLRQLRLCFNLDSLYSLRLIQDIFSHNPAITYDEVWDFLKKHPSSFRPFPSYIELEIYRGCEYSCNFCPRTFVNLQNDFHEMKLITLERILKEIEISFGNEVTLCFGGLGEPLLHKEIFYFLNFALNQEIVHELILETALYKNANELEHFIKTLTEKQSKKLTLIVNLPSTNQITYSQMTGQEQISVNQILESIQRLKNILPKENLYVQILKIEELEDEMENYVSYFDKESISVIIQKYNSYAQKMKERRSADFTPIQREFCWHLFRDLYVSFDGTVELCKQLGGTTLGNILEQDLVNIWEKGLIFAQHSFNLEHEKIPAPCLKCDEWYTFNA